MTPLDRREFIAGTAGVAAAVAGLPGRSWAKTNDGKVRLGFIGVGGRGTHLLELALRRSDTVVNAVCDISEDALSRATDLVREHSGVQTAAYGDGDEAFLQLVARDDLDAVVIATPWRWHTTMAVAAMRNGKAAGVEVPAAVTLQECWDLVNTSEETGMACMLMENVCYRRDVMAVFNMVKQGMFGELMHMHCGYQHDLRNIKFQPGVEFGPGARGEAVWRTQHSIKRNGDVYPTHGVGPVAKALDINAGNRFVSLTSHATKTRGLHNYIVEHGGEDHPNADITFALGDIVTTVIQCANGETVLVSHDTNLPRPYSLNFRVQGTKGIWMDDNRSIYLEGVSPEAHRWEPFAPYQEQYDHPLWKRYSADSQGAGHGGMDFFVVNAFIESVKRGVAPPVDVYDAAAWSAISALSEQSISMGNHPVQFPDFTRGKWVTAEPTFGASDEF